MPDNKKDLGNESEMNRTEDIITNYETSSKVLGEMAFDGLSSSDDKDILSDEEYERLSRIADERFGFTSEDDE